MAKLEVTLSPDWLLCFLAQLERQQRGLEGPAFQRCLRGAMALDSAIVRSWYPSFLARQAQQGQQAVQEGEHSAQQHLQQHQEELARLQQQQAAEEEELHQATPAAAIPMGIPGREPPPEPLASMDFDLEAELEGQLPGGFSVPTEAWLRSHAAASSQESGCEAASGAPTEDASAWETDLLRDLGGESLAGRLDSDEEQDVGLWAPRSNPAEVAALHSTLAERCKEVERFQAEAAQKLLKAQQRQLTALSSPMVEQLYRLRNDLENARKRVRKEKAEAYEQVGAPLGSCRRLSRAWPAFSQKKFCRSPLIAIQPQSTPNSEAGIAPLPHQAVSAVMLKMLPVLDNFDRAAASLKTATEGERAVQDQYQSVRDLLMEVLDQYGLKELPCEGLPFDPSQHEAVMSEYNSEVPEGTVLACFQKGFTMTGRRPASEGGSDYSGDEAPAGTDSEASPASGMLVRPALVKVSTR